MAETKQSHMTFVSPSSGRVGNQQHDYAALFHVQCEPGVPPWSFKRSVSFQPTVPVAFQLQASGNVSRRNRRGFFSSRRTLNNCIMYYILPCDVQGHANKIERVTDRIATDWRGMKERSTSEDWSGTNGREGNHGVHDNGVMNRKLERER